MQEKIIEQESQQTSSQVISPTDALGQVLGKEQPRRVRGLGFGPCPSQIFGCTTNRLGKVSLNSTLDPTVTSLQQEVTKLQSELQSSNDIQKEMRGALAYIFQNYLGNVPPEFSHLINPQVC